MADGYCSTHRSPSDRCRLLGLSVMLALFVAGSLGAEERILDEDRSAPDGLESRSADFEEASDSLPPIEWTSEWSNSHFEPAGPSQQWADEFAGPEFPDEEPGIGASPPPAELSATEWLGTQLTGTWIVNEGDSGFGDLGLDVNGSLAWHFNEYQSPLVFTPGFAVDHWSGGFAENLPSQVYSAYVDLNWRPQVSDVLALNLGVSPGLYGDYQEFDGQTLQWSGWALAEITLSPEWQLVGGATFVRQLESRVLPAGGAIWVPNCDTRLELVFPRPRVARRVYVSDEVEYWAYVAGQYGGGAWAVTLEDETRDLLLYSDLRLLLGVEWDHCRGILGVCELGYVFDRELSLSDDSASPNSTVLVRAGITF